MDIQHQSIQDFTSENWACMGLEVKGSTYHTMLSPSRRRATWLGTDTGAAWKAPNVSALVW